MGPRIWVARLEISRRTAAKISNVHGLQEADVRDAVQCVSGLPFVWDDDPERGLRAIVEVEVAGKPALVVLYPVSDLMDDVWHLGSAYQIKKR